MKALITAVDVLLVLLAVIVMGVGLAREWSLRQSKKGTRHRGDWAGLFAYLLQQKQILRRPAVGVAHLFVFWGLALPMIVIGAAQFGFTLPAGMARILHLLQDILGASMLLATVYLLRRRLGLSSGQGPQRTVLLMGVLLAILISGFMAEGARLGILNSSQFPWFSPVGWLFAQVLPASPLFMQAMIRIHFVAVCVLIAIIPFSFLRHALAAPLNVFYKKQGPKAALRPLRLEAGDIGANSVTDLSWKQLLDAQACVACGRCDEHCPAAISGKSLSPRKVMQDIFSQAKAFSCAHSQNGGRPVPLQLDGVICPDEFWACTSCMACVTHCPVSAEPLDKIIDLRRHQVMGLGQLPAEARAMVRGLDLYGDVQGKGAAHRADWAMHRLVPVIGSAAAEIDILLWVGCAGSYHPRNQQTSRSMVKILQAAGIRFAILGKAERCCGDPARRLGDEILFQKLAHHNIEQLNRCGAQTVVTLCPHCLNTLKNEYPAFGCQVKVAHATEYVMRLVDQGHLELRYPLAKKLAIHDACYLGRYNDVYEAPRQLCRNVPELMLSELAQTRENSFCCGGGGGRMWLHEHGGQSINGIRAAQIRQSQVELIGTSCPYCLVMLDDGLKSLEMEKTPVVADIIDIVADALE